MRKLLLHIAAFCTEERVRRYPTIIAITFLLVWIGGFLLNRQDRAVDAWGKFLGNDFVAFYTGGSFLLQNRLDDLYNLGAQHTFQQSLTHVELAQTSPFINPPYATFLYAPFAAIHDYLLAIIAWYALGILAIFLSAKLVKQSGPLFDHTRLKWLIAQVILIPPFLLWLGYGQATPFVLLILSASYSTLTKEQPVRSGIILGCLAFKPQLALGLVLVMLIRTRIKALISGFITLLCWIGIGALWMPDAMNTWWSMRSQWIDMLRDPTYPSWGVCSLYGFFNTLIAPINTTLADSLTVLTSLALIIALGKMLWDGRSSPLSSIPNQARLAIVLMCNPLLSIQYYTYDLVLCVLPIWIIYAISTTTAQPQKKTYLDGAEVLAMTAILGATTLLGPLFLSMQLEWFKSFHLPPVGIQPVTLVIIAWSFYVYKRYVKHTNPFKPVSC